MRQVTFILPGSDEISHDLLARIVTEIATGEADVIRALYNGTLFYSIMAMSAGNTINSVALTVFGEPIIDGQHTLWAIGQFEIMRTE